MPSANLDLVRSIYAAWGRGEILPTDPTAELVHPNIEIAVVDGPEPSSRKGMAAATPGIEGFLASGTTFASKQIEYRELDDERVLVLSRVIGRGARSRGRPCSAQRACSTSVTGSSPGSSCTGTATERSTTSASHRTPAPDPAVYAESPAARDASP
jgi:hypothetical protein